MATLGEAQVWEPITPTGTALVLLIVTCIFSVLIMIVLQLRFYIRVYTRCLGFEDWLMFAGFVSNFPTPTPSLRAQLLGLQEYGEWFVKPPSTPLSQIYEKLLWATTDNFIFRSM